MNLAAKALLALVFAGTAAIAASCVHVAEERARRDLEVGQAEHGDVRVSVAEGLAAVRHLARGRLELWAGAPALSISMSIGPESGGEWTIRMDNVLSNAELLAEAPPGQALDVALVDAPAPTERTWRVDLPAGTGVALTLRPPDADLPDPWRFAVYADVQEAIDEVQDIYIKMNAHPGIRFALISGDLTSQGTVEELTRFQREMKTLNFPCYATLGNHELGTAPPPYHDYFGRGNYSFVFRGVQFTMIDSASATIDPMVYGWLDGWLAAGRERLHVTTMHIPPLDPVGLRNGAFASRAEADKLLALFAGGGVDLTVYGHLHTYYAFENAGIPAYISGGGGAIPERMDGIGRHFLAVDVIPSGTFSQVAVVRVD
jgi:3',5'-cyclic AMP phosphodiesterase CpdA